MKKYKRIFIPTVFLLMLFSLFICNQSIRTKPLGEAPKAQSGVLDLRTWNFDKYGLVKLEGGWDYYEGDFLTDSHIKSYLIKQILFRTNNMHLRDVFYLDSVN